MSVKSNLEVKSLELASSQHSADIVTSTLSLPILPPSPPSLPSPADGESPSPRPHSPVPVPAPRRKRKQRREDTASLRGSFRARKKGNTTILEELEEKVRELEESQAKKEEELKLADSEAAELSSRLQVSQQLAKEKVMEHENNGNGNGTWK